MDSLHSLLPVLAVLFGVSQMLRAAEYAAPRGLKDAVSSQSTSRRLVHSKELGKPQTFLKDLKPLAPLSREEAARAQALAVNARVPLDRVIALRQQGLSWEDVAKRVGYHRRQSRLFDRTGVLLGRLPR